MHGLTGRACISRQAPRSPPFVLPQVRVLGARGQPQAHRDVLSPIFACAPCGRLGPLAGCGCGAGTYAALTSEVARADFARYAMLYQYGGVYADMDVECMRPFDDLVKYDPPPKRSHWDQGETAPGISCVLGVCIFSRVRIGNP